MTESVDLAVKCAASAAVDGCSGVGAEKIQNTEKLKTDSQPILIHRAPERVESSV